MGMTCPVVLVPGLVCDAAVWEHVRPHLASRAEVHVAHHGAPDSLGSMADKVLREAPDRFAIAGHSMGGRVALEVWRRAAERDAAQPYLHPGGTPPRGVKPANREAAGRNEPLEIPRRQGMAAMASRWVQGM